MMNFMFTEENIITLDQVLERCCNEENDEIKGICFIQDDGTEIFESYQDLYANAKLILGELQERGVRQGAHVIFQMNQNSSFLTLFWACMLGGIVAVPLPVPLIASDKTEGFQKLTKVAKQLSEEWIIAESETIAIFKDGYESNHLRYIEFEGLCSGNQVGEGAVIKRQDVAYIQYSSGSTGNPKGVILTHENLVYHFMQISERLHLVKTDVTASWLPLTHDMGLIGYHMTPLFAGFTQIQLSPGTFLRKPWLYLQKITQKKATIAVTPNFGLELMVDKIKEAQLDQIDLSSLRTIMCGAEPIAMNSVRRFYQKYTEYGLREDTIYQVYGMAEACLAVTIPFKGHNKSVTVNRHQCRIGQQVEYMSLNDPDTSEYAMLGQPLSGIDVMIVDDDDKVLQDNCIGNIVIKGKNIFQGYMNQESSPFNKDGFYNTGDLGFVCDGELIVTGRKKDILFVNGQNYYSSDIEQVLAMQLPQLSQIVVCAFRSQTASKDEIAVFVQNEENADVFLPLAKKIKNMVLERIGIGADYVIPVTSIPKTTSGKVQRYRLIEQLENHEFDDVIAIAPYSYQRVAKASIEQEDKKKEIEDQVVIIAKEVFSTDALTIDDTISQLGISSLTLIRFQDELHQRFQVEIPIASLIKISTLKELSQVIGSQLKSEDNELTELTGNPDLWYEPFPVTEIQEAYLIGRQNTIEMGNVSTHAYYEIETGLDLMRLTDALNKVIKHQFMLRTIFDETGLQKVLKRVPHYNIETKDLRNLSPQEQNQQILLMRKRRSHFVHEQDHWPLFEFSAFMLGDNRNYLFVDIDLLIADGGSFTILMKEIMDYYENPDIKMEPLNFQFSDYVTALLSFHQDAAYQRDQEFWNAKAENFAYAPALPMICSTETIDKPTFKRKERKLSADQWNHVQGLANQHHVSPSVFLCTIYAEILGKWSNQTRMALNLTLFNRQSFHKDVARLIGDFTSVLLLDIDLSAQSDFWERAAMVRNCLFEAVDHRFYSGVDVIRNIAGKRKMTSKAIMPIVFTSMLFDKSELSNSMVKWGKMQYGISQTPQVFLDFQVMERDGELWMTWDYVDDLFDQDMIDSMFETYQLRLQQILMVQLTSIALPQKQAELWNTYNDTSVEYHIDLLHHLIDQQCTKTPDAIAVKLGDETLSYAELAVRTNQTARYLKDKNYEHGSYIGVWAERRIETIVNIVAILKAGHAYIPVNPEHPKDRIDYIMQHSKMKQMLYPDLYEKEHLSEYCTEALAMTGEFSLSDKAYVIFTSGSTGHPKGVVITHEAVVNTLLDINERFHVDSKDKIIALSSMCFDLSVYDIFGALISGAELVMIPDLLDMDHIGQVVTKEKITIWNSVPAIMDMFMESSAHKAISEASFESLRLVMMSGDWIPLGLPDKINSRIPQAELISLGGATEGSIWSIYYPIKVVNPSWKSIPYGYPLKNQHIYVLDTCYEECPIGVAGELYIGGKGVASGYLNDEEKTKAAFINHRLGTLYRTGDFGVMHQEGYIEFLGRRDSQIKIRGHRIELGEIEHCLNQIAGIHQSVVADYSDHQGEKHLCGYIVADLSMELNDLQEQLKKQLPDYMIPAQIVQVDEIPLSSNGKVDRSRLPKPGITCDESSKNGAYEEPKSEEETLVTKAFEAVLGLEKVGVNDNFFDLGGDSIKAIHILNKIREAGYDSSMRNLLMERTPRQIAKSLCMKKETINAEQDEISGEVLLTPIQSYFFAQKMEYPKHFNISQIFEARVPVNVEALHQVLAALVQHHDMLRATYQDEHQRIGKSTDKRWYGFTQIDCEPDEVKEKVKLIQVSMNLEAGPLLQAVVFHTTDKDYLLLSVHHIVMDVISWNILSQDLERSYRQVMNHREIKLPAKTVSFKAWSEGLKSYASSKKFEKACAYWDKIEEKLEFGRLTADSTEKGYEHKTEVVSLDAKTTDSLMKKSAQAYHTEINDLLLTALGRAVHQVTGQTTLTLQMEGHGREETAGAYDLGRTIGWFTSIYPVVLEELGSGIAKDIRNTKETLRRIPSHGFDYGIMKQKNGMMEIAADVSFNYLSEFNTESGADKPYFKFSELGYGQDSDPHNQFGPAINVVGFVTNGALTMNVTCNSSRYSADRMKQLCMAYKEELTAIANHCINADTSEFTASDYGELVWTDSEFQKVQDAIRSQGDEIERIYQLTPMQEGMLYEKLMEEESTRYVVQQTMRLSNMNVDKMHHAFLQLARKHEVLRTKICYRNVSEPRQVVLKERTLEFHYTEVDNEHDYLQLKSQDVKRGFDLEEDTLIRMNIVKLKDSGYRLIMTNYHIILDGWCLPILRQELFEAYMAPDHADKSTSIEVYDSGSRFEDFVHYINENEKESGYQYWEELLDGYEVRADILPIGSNENVDEESQSQEFCLSEEATKQAEAICTQYGSTLNTFVEACWSLLLQKYNSTNDVVFGKVVSGRNAKLNGIEKIVGLCINTIPVRAVTTSGQSFAELLSMLQSQAIAANDYDDCSLAKIQNRSTLGRDLIGTLFFYEGYQARNLAIDCGLEVEFEAYREQISYNLGLTAFRSDALHVRLIYNTKVYSKEEIAILGTHLKNLMECVIAGPETMLDAITMTDAAEEKNELINFNETAAEYPREKTIIQLFEEQVLRTPDQVAVVYEGQTLTYEQLNSCANALALKLRREYKIQPDDFVAIITERCLEMVIGLYAILKSGAAYVPIDPSYPKERMEYILEDCHPKAILIGSCNVTIPYENVVNLCENCKEETYVQNLEHVNTSHSLVYLVYTSGTTGKPKGVMVENRHIVNQQLWTQREYPLHVGESLLMKTTCVFDVFAWEVFWWMLEGGTVVILPHGQESDGDRIISMIKNHNITAIQFVPSMFNLFLDQLERSKEQITSLRYLINIGEKLNAESVRKYNRLMEQGQVRAQLMNLYGPAETTVNSTGFVCPSDVDINRVLIGTPISNTQIYIRNGQSTAGIGVPGELCIAGDSVSRGYLNRAELTAQKFVSNPYGHGKMYRTGDLARWLPDGNIEYLGRMDDQVKIRGFRIEPGEIESVLQTLDGVTQAAVVVKQDSTGEKILCAYVVSRITEEGTYELSEDEIRQRLHEKLPDYMVPAYIMRIDAIPLSHNGKLNKAALPQPVYQSREYVAPANKEEIIVANAVEKILGIHNVSITDNFFNLGGHSLKATLLCNELEKASGIRIGLREVFEMENLRSIADKMRTLKHNDFLEIPKIPKAESYPMSSAQRRLYLLNEMSGPNIAYNISHVIRYESLLDLNKLQKALDQLLANEEVLRTSFHLDNGELVQKIESDVRVVIEYESSDTISIQTEYDEFIRLFDLSKAPLMRVKLIHTSKESYIILDIHHMIFDGESLPVMLRALNELYEGHTLVTPRIWYKDYCAWQNKQELKEQAEYWKQEFAHDIPVLELPTDYSRPAKKSFHGDSVKTDIEEGTAESINRLAKKYGATEFMVLLSAYMVLLHQYTRQQDIVIGTPVSGRTHVDTHNMLGMFVNTLAIREKVIPEENFEQLLLRVKEKCLMAYDNQEYQYEDLVEAVQKTRNQSRNPLFDVMFLLSDSVIDSDGSGILGGRWVSMEGTVSKFDLNLMLIHTANGYVANLEYCTDLFKKETVVDMVNGYVALLNEVVTQPEKKLSNLSMPQSHSTEVMLEEIAPAKAEPEKNVDLLAQQFSNLLQAIRQRDDAYWIAKAETFFSAPSLPYLCDPSQVEHPVMDHLDAVILAKDWSLIKNRAQDMQIAPSALLATIYAEVLHKWTNQAKLSIDMTAASNQPFHLDAMSMFGDSMSELYIDIDLTLHQDFWDRTLQTQKTLFDALDHRFYNRENVRSNLASKQDMDCETVMPVLFSYQSLMEAGMINTDNKQNQMSRVFLELKAKEQNGGLMLSLEYASELLDEDIMASMFETLKLRLQQVITGQLASIPLPAKQEVLLREYNNTNAEYDGELVHKLIDKQCQKTPDAIAVKAGKMTLTYRELARKSNQIAHYLKDRNLKHGSYIGIWAERRIETILNIVGVLKAGCAYVPINPEHPKERIDYIMEHSGIDIMLYPDLYEKEQLVSYSENSFDDAESCPQDKAYVIYTSGSTGHPKGVVITHEAVVNTLIDINERFHVNEDDKIIALSSMCFDLSVYDIFGALISGAQLVMIPNLLDMDHINQVLVDEKVTIWNSVPAIMDMYIENIAHRVVGSPKIESLRLVMMSGDWIPLNLPDKIKTHIPNASIISLGGATEGSIWSIYFPIKEIRPEWKSIPYGYPLRNQKIYVLNEFKEQCPVNVPGELYIGGIGVAKGYLNEEEKTKAAFIDHPFGYIYKTGDYGVMCKEGYVEFLGRRDSQIKIRGHRIELGEIEHCLNNLSQIRQSVVADYLDHQGEKQLCGYVVSEKELELSMIQEQLAKRLPDYMIPAKIMQLDAIPLSSNGKVERSKLPDPCDQPEGSSMTTKYEAPATITENLVVEAFSQVLGCERVGVNDSFFELGGHSLKVIQLCNELEKTTGVRVPLKDIFDQETPRRIAKQIKSSSISGFSDIERIAKADYYAVSSAQKRLYLLDKLTGPTTTYNIPAAVKLNRVPDKERLMSAFNQLIEQEEILRTSFHMEDGKPVQSIAESASIILEQSKVESEDIEVIQQEFNHFVQPFDLSKAPLMRVKLLDTTNSSYLFLDIHHILCDAGSIPVMLYKLQQLYEGHTLEQPRVQYKDFCAWQNARDITSQANYWKNEFSGEIPLLDLMTDYARPQTQSFKGANVRTRIELEISDSVKALAKKHGATEFMVLLSTFMTLLAKYSRQEEIVVGTPISGRTHADTQNMLGMFVNTLAIRSEVRSDMSFEQLLQVVKEKCLQAYDHQEYQFDDLVEAIELKRDFSRNPIFDVMFVLQNNDSEIYEDDIHIGTWAAFDGNISKFDLTLNMISDEKGYAVDFEYCTDLFKPETIKEMASHFVTLLHEILLSPEKNLSNLRMIDSMEEERILVDFNATDADYHHDKTIVELFEEQVKQTPCNIAVEFEGQQLTYAQLDARANSMARVLRQKYEVRPNDFVVILTERCLEMVVGIYAILKAGAAYVPVDPSYPEERISFIINDCKAKVLVCGDCTPATDLPIVHLHDTANYELDEGELACVNQPDDLMYAIYTSGTTGWPKGVMIEHINVVRLLCNDKFTYDFKDTDVWTFFHSYCFDVSVWELFGCTLNGGKLIIPSQDTVKDSYKFGELLKNKGVTVLCQVPSPFYALMDATANQTFDSLRYVILAGEALHPALLKEWHENNQQCRIVNMYGPTETTVYATSREIDDEVINRGISDIGKPVPTLKMYILNGNEICGIGVPGELCIAGVGVARGYLNREELTKEKFVSNPFGENTMYRTGDLVRWLSDGNIEYIGRMDDQAKIRGYRIEPREIENCLLKIDGINAAVVVVREDQVKDKFLCGYVITEEGIEEKDIKNQLKKLLPEYMVPSCIIRMDAMPLTRNGKLDRTALPAPEYQSKEYVAPRSETETLVEKAFEDTLGITKISVTDSFFDLGGTSLKAVLLGNELEKATGVRLALRDIFVLSTPEQIADKIEHTSVVSYAEIPKVAQAEYYPTSSAQKRLYLMDKMMGPNISYNISDVISYEEPLDKERLQNALDRLLEREEVLRTSFKEVDGEPVQMILAHARVRLEYQEEDTIDIQQEYDNFVQPFDLSKAPLMRVKLVQTTSGSYLFVDIHHIICDGESLPVLLQQVNELY